MNDPLPTTCAWVQDRISMYLDGVLAAASKAKLQLHLKQCRDCVATVRQYQRLAKQVQQVPLREPPSSFAQRVVRAHRQRRHGLSRLGRSAPFWRSPSAIAAIAASLLLAGFLAGYLAGTRSDAPVETSSSSTEPHALQRSGSGQSPPANDPELSSPTTTPITSSGEPATSSGSSPPSELASSVQDANTEVPLRRVKLQETLDEYRAQGVEPEKLARAAYGFVGDIALLDQVEESLRVPLLASQVQRFDLADQSDRWLRFEPRRRHDQIDELTRLISFVHEAAVSLEQGNVRFGELQQGVIAGGFLECIPPLLEEMRPLTGIPSARSDTELLTLIREVAPRVSTDNQRHLAEILSAKDSWVLGRNDDLVRSARRHLDHQNAESFGTALDFILASGLSEFGFPEMAELFASDLLPQHQSSVRIIIRTSVETREK